MFSVWNRNRFLSASLIIKEFLYLGLWKYVCWNNITISDQVSIRRGDCFLQTTISWSLSGSKLRNSILIQKALKIGLNYLEIMHLRYYIAFRVWNAEVFAVILVTENFVAQVRCIRYTLCLDSYLTFMIQLLFLLCVWIIRIF